ncbi:MAG: undecaprenyl-diphosphate phosphatase [Verrucomicrobia bacterium]|nr:undecaprenyl-diphosphate phosphatase [Verrucomicrobiota bacterium]MDA1085916.1 undecaprenyl-diphosphate phosphatase [Verrucomicrobiota bacterium]
MPDILKVILLAVVQGLTEFLPVSSSGHIVLVNRFLGLETPDVTLEVTIHAGTLLAVLAYYRIRIAKFLADVKQFNREGKHDLLTVTCGTIPIVIAGLAFKQRLEPLFDDPSRAAWMLIVTGLMLCTLFIAPRSSQKMTGPISLIIGFAQAIALLPGISRSGTTITVARHFGIAPEKAAEFSLLLMLPAVGGAIILASLDISDAGLGNLTVVELLCALATSALVGYGAIILLVKALSAGYFKWFGIYCIIAGAAGVFL